MENKEDSKVYVLDTNIILNDAHNINKISQFGQNVVILPETVIDELDSKKSGTDEINFQAREFARMLSEATFGNVEKNDKATILNISLKDNSKIQVISLNNYELDNIERSIKNDRKIIQVAKYCSEDLYKEAETTFLSLDAMCFIRAYTLGLKADFMTYKNKDQNVEFLKVINVDRAPNEGDNILDFDKEHKPENYSYIFKYAKDKESLGYINENKIKLVNMNDLNRGAVKPLNNEQALAMSGMLDKEKNIVIIEALAGSGKTLLALNCGMRAIDKGHFDRIIYIRNSIESLDKGEEIGFLSGNNEKLEIYNYPLFDTLEMIVRTKKLKKKETEEDLKNKIDKLIEKYRIETMWLGGIRGRTITNSYVIIDEIQNFSRKSLQTVLSRMDNKSKVVCIGSNNQIDNNFVNKYTNGLSLLLNVFKENENMSGVNLFATKLNKVMRGEITEWTEKVFKDK